MYVIHHVKKFNQRVALGQRRTTKLLVLVGYYGACWYNVLKSRNNVEKLNDNPKLSNIPHVRPQKHRNAQNVAVFVVFNTVRRNMVMLHAWVPEKHKILYKLDASVTLRYFPASMSVCATI